MEYETQKGLPVSGAVGREKAIQLCNFYTGLGVRRRAASIPVRDSLKMLVQCEE
jgi:hypothetical protein